MRGRPEDLARLCIDMSWDSNAHAFVMVQGMPSGLTEFRGCLRNSSDQFLRRTRGGEVNVLLDGSAQSGTSNLGISGPDVQTQNATGRVIQPQIHRSTAATLPVRLTLL